MKRLLYLFLMTLSIAASAQTFPVQNLTVGGTSTFTGTMSGSGLASHDANINHVQTVLNVAALRANPCSPGLIYSDQGYTILGDGGQGQYVCNGSDTTSSDNGGSIIAASNGYRLYLQSPSGLVSVRTFGARGDGITDDASAINAAYTYANTLESAKVIYPPSQNNYKMNSILTMYPNKVGTDGMGSAIDFSAISSGYAINFTQTNNDPNARAAANKAHPIENLLLIGPSSGTTTAVDASDHNPASGVPTIAGIVIKGVGFQGFPVDVEFGNGAFLWTFIADNFYITGGTSYTTSQLIDNGSNSGENISYISCFFGKVYGTVITNYNPNTSIISRGSSFDYNSQIVLTTGGYIELDGYIESNNDTAYWFDISGANTVVKVSGDFVVTGSKSNYEFFNIQSSATNGGLVLDAAIEFAGGVNYSPPSKSMVTGSGRVVWDYRASSNSTVHPAIGGSSNFLANPGFENTNISEWTLSGTSPPARETSVFHSGIAALGFSFTAGAAAQPTATKYIACNPGQHATGGFWYQAPSVAGTGGTAYITFTYLDSSGTLATAASSALVAATTNIGSWTYVSAGQTLPAPSGTQKGALSATIFGVTTGVATMFVDDVAISCN